ncbi:MAG: hypothetical protein R2873_08575 [Caldilineaceae bacterium]|nr:hypothetical protein [Caldilineaceae bacterium]
MEFLLGASFWSANAALWGIGGVALLLIMLWDWRLFLPGLALIQYGVGQVLVYRYGVPGQWLAIYFWVIVLAALILALSPLQMPIPQSSLRSGNPFFRLLIMVLLGLLVYTLQPDIPLPVLDEPTTRLLLWLVACAFLVMALTDSALFTAIGLFFWFIPLQSLMAVILPLPALIALIGILQLMVALACAYLTLAEDAQIADLQQPATDVTFPSQADGTTSPLLDLSALRRFISERMTVLLALLKRSQ